MSEFRSVEPLGDAALGRAKKTGTHKTKSGNGTNRVPRHADSFHSDLHQELKADLTDLQQTGKTGRYFLGFLVLIR